MVDNKKVEGNFKIDSKKSQQVLCHVLQQWVSFLSWQYTHERSFCVIATDVANAYISSSQSVGKRVLDCINESKGAFVSYGSHFKLILSWIGISTN